MSSVGIAAPVFSGEVHRQVVDALVVPVSSGEFEATRFRFADLIALGNPDILQPDIHANGRPIDGGPPVPVHVKVDTGMARLGVSLGELGGNLGNVLEHELPDGPPLHRPGGLRQRGSGEQEQEQEEAHDAGA